MPPDADYLEITISPDITVRIRGDYYREAQSAGIRLIKVSIPVPAAGHAPQELPTAASFHGDQPARAAGTPQTSASPPPSPDDLEGGSPPSGFVGGFRCEACE